LPGILIAGSSRLRQRIKLRFLLRIVTGEQRPRGGGDAAILLGIVRFERIIQLIEEDRQVAGTLGLRSRQHGFSPVLDHRKQLRPRNIFLISELLLHLRYHFDRNQDMRDIYRSGRSVAEELADPEDWLASIPPKLIPL
jgi:hypothetical protein